MCCLSALYAARVPHSARRRLPARHRATRLEFAVTASAEFSRREVYGRHSPAFQRRAVVLVCYLTVSGLNSVQFNLFQNSKSTAIGIFQIICWLPYWRLLLSMDIKCYIQVGLMLWIYFILVMAEAGDSVSLTSTYDEADSYSTSPDLGDSSNATILGCLPCSQLSPLSSLLEKHATLHNSDFQALLIEEFDSDDSCGKLLHNTSNVFSHSVLKWDLVGEGSHRRLISSLRFDIHSDGVKWLDAYFCEAVIIESLPTGVFADSFELQHLVHCGVLLDAAVFGDTNLELPSSLSNPSIVKLHLDIGNHSLLESHEGLQITSELPLHARYPPLDASGYSKVEINLPDVLMLCKPKLSQHDCSSVVICWGTRFSRKVVWRVPCGNQAHAGIVSVVTFASTLVSALIIVYTAVFCSSSSKDTMCL